MIYETVSSESIDLSTSPARMVIDGVYYEMSSEGFGTTRTITVNANQYAYLDVTNTYTVSGDQPEPDQGIIQITKNVVLPEEIVLPADYTVTLTLSDGFNTVGSHTFTAVDLANGSASFTMTVDAGTYNNLRLDETVNELTVDGKTYTLTSSGTGLLDSVSVAAGATTALAVTNTYADGSDPDPDPSTDPSPDPSDDPTTEPSDPGTTPPDDEDDSSTDIQDDDTPLGPNPGGGTDPDPTPSEEPSDPGTGTDIPDENTPLGPNPGGDPDPETGIPEGQTPMGDLPQTGAVLTETAAAPVNPATTAGLTALAFSMVGAGLYFTFGRKKGEEED